MIWAVLGPHSNLHGCCYLSCIWGNTEIICSILVNPKNNMVSDMPVLFQ